MEKRTLGSQGLRVSMLGLGCMGMSEFYGPRDEAEALATLDRALELERHRPDPRHQTAALSRGERRRGLDPALPRRAREDRRGTPPGVASGTRYPEAMMKLVERP